MEIPLNLRKKSCTIVSNASTRNTLLCEIKDTLTARNYLPTLIDIGFQRALRHGMRKRRHHKLKNGLQPQTLPYIFTYKLLNSKVFSAILQNIIFFLSPSLSTSATTVQTIKTNNSSRIILVLLSTAC